MLVISVGLAAGKIEFQTVASRRAQSLGSASFPGRNRNKSVKFLLEYPNFSECSLLRAGLDR